MKGLEDEDADVACFQETWLSEQQSEQLSDEFFKAMLAAKRESWQDMTSRLDPKTDPSKPYSVLCAMDGRKPAATTSAALTTDTGKVIVGDGIKLLSVDKTEQILFTLNTSECNGKVEPQLVLNLRNSSKTVSCNVSDLCSADSSDGDPSAGASSECTSKGSEVEESEESEESE
eukprot:gene2124-13430_t